MAETDSHDECGRIFVRIIDRANAHLSLPRRVRGPTSGELSKAADARNDIFPNQTEHRNAPASRGDGW